MRPTLNDSHPAAWQGGGGPAELACHYNWTLFNGNAEHETRPFYASREACPACAPLPVLSRRGRQDLPRTRVSFICFSHASYNKIPAVSVLSISCNDVMMHTRAEHCEITPPVSPHCPCLTASGEAAIGPGIQRMLL